MKLLVNIQSGISFKNPDPFSPRRDAKSNLKIHRNRGFSGPIIPEAGRNNKFDDDDNAKEEPTSPKISCMGQIKQKNKMIIKKKTKNTPVLPKQENPFSREHPGSGFWTSRTVHDSGRPIYETEEKGKRRQRQNSQIMFGSTAKSTGREPESRVGEGGAPPRLGQLKKFESGHDTLNKIDWTTGQEEGREDDEEEEEFRIPFSATILMERVKPVVQLEQKKEINLWKRRTLAQPQPLHLK